MSPSHRILILADTIGLLLIIAAIFVRVSNDFVQSPVRPNLPQSSQSNPIRPEQSNLKVTPSFLQPILPQSGNGSQTGPLPTAVLPDQITSKAYLVGNVQTGKVYLAYNDTSVLAVASMSKLVTAIAATDNIASATEIMITQPETDVPPDGSDLQAGERFTVGELLYPLLLDSSNVAAEALASSTNLVQFEQLMSSYAWEIGMPNTFFADPSGVNPHNESTAQDMFVLAQYLYKYRPDLLAITRTVSTSVATTTDHGAHVFASIHPFVTDPRFIGGKTGRTPQAGETMMTILDINDQPIAFIILGSQYSERQEDTQKLISKFEGMEI